MKRIVRIGLAVAALVGGMLLVLPTSPASAAPLPPGWQVVSQSFTGATPSTVDKTLTCPSGTRVVNVGGGNAQVLAMSPVNSFTAARFVAEIFQQPPGNSAFLTVTCAPNSQFTDVKTVISTDHRPVPGQFFQASARCPANTYAFGGGGYFGSGSSFLPAAFNNITNAPSADGNSWEYSGITPANTTTATTVVQCAPRIGRNVLINAQVQSPNQNTFNSVYSDCPVGWTAISGGPVMLKPSAAPASAGSIVWSVPANHQVNGVTRSSWYASGATETGSFLGVRVQCVQ